MHKLMLLLLSVFLAMPAAAQAFIDCKSPQMIELLKPQLPKFKCAEISKAKPGGVTVRYLWDASDKTFAPNLPAVYQTMSIANDTIAKALQRWEAVTSFDVHEVTIVIGSTNTAIEFDGKRFRGLTVAPARYDSPTDCVVILDLNRIWEKSGALERPRDLAFVVAHEFAHCVQRWNYFKGMEKPGSDWWIEGLASTLGQVAVPDSSVPHGPTGSFLTKIATTPFTKLSYENAMLFQWMWNRKPLSLFQFMNGVEHGAGATLDDQVAMLVSVAGVGPGMSDFVRKLVDDAVPDPGGWLSGALKPGAPITISGSAHQVLAGEPYTIHFQPVIFKGGRYAASLNSNNTPVARGVRAEGAATWSDDFPLWVGSEDCNKDGRTQIVFMKTGKAATAVVDAQKKAECNKDVLLSGAGQGNCPIGTWDVDNAARGALLSSWLGRDGKVTGTSGTMRFNFGTDNRSTIEAKDFAADIAGGAEHGLPPLNVHVAVSGTDSGTWSASGGMLTYKNGGGTLKLDILIKVAGMTFPAPSVEPFNDGQWKYDCSGDTLQLTYAGPSKVPAGHVPTFTLRRATHW